MSRIANAPRFSLSLLAGHRITELIGATESDIDDLIEMLFIRIDDATDWHRVFLQAGIGFWENMSKQDAFSEFEDLRQIDFADRWGIRGASLLSAECIGGTWEDSVLSQFEFVLSLGTVRLNFADLTDMDSDSMITFEP
ncbi:MAG: hypothetical protein N2C14_27640 [Planctomycetales bacterium]